MAGIDTKTLAVAQQYAEKLALGGAGLQEKVENTVNTYLAENPDSLSESTKQNIDTYLLNDTENVLNPTLSSGSFYKADNEIKETANNTYAKTGFLQYQKGTVIHITLSDNYTVCAYGFDSETDANYSTTNYQTADFDYTVTKDYVRFVVRQNIDGIYQTVNIDDVFTNVKMAIEKKSLIFDYVNLLNPLYNKSVYFDGDSICYGANSGGRSYADIIASNNNMIIDKKAVSGTTIAIRDGYTNSILERIKSMSGSYDYIVIEGGYNDGANSVSMGELTTDYTSDLDETTFIGAMESICKTLCANYFESKKLFIIPHRTLGKVVGTYFDAAIEVCKKWGIPYIDLRDECNLIPLIGESIQTEYFEGASTGTHPTLQGYKTFYAPKIEGRMRTL